MASAQTRMRRAIEDGDLARGLQPIGQVQGLVKDAPPAADLMRRNVAEASAAARVVGDAQPG